MQIDQTGYNVSYWKGKTQTEFLAEYNLDIHRPAGVSKADWKTILIDHHTALKHNPRSSKDDIED